MMKNYIQIKDFNKKKEEDQLKHSSNSFVFTVRVQKINLFNKQERTFYVI